MKGTGLTTIKVTGKTNTQMSILLTFIFLFTKALISATACCKKETWQNFCFEKIKFFCAIVNLMWRNKYFFSHIYSWFFNNSKKFMEITFLFCSTFAVVVFFLYLNVNIADSIERTKLKFSNSVEMKLKFNITKKKQRKMLFNAYSQDTTRLRFSCFFWLLP